MSSSLPEDRQPRAPLHLCALTLNPHNHPVAAPDGTVFESTTILQLIRRTGLNPITGQPLSPQSLVPLSISTDPRTSLPRCPILFHTFNQNIKIVAIRTSGNVYSFAAIQRLNIQPHNMTDLIDRTPFTMHDLIVLFDPQQHIWSTHPQDVLDTHPASRQLQPHHITLTPYSIAPPPHPPPTSHPPIIPIQSLHRDPYLPNPLSSPSSQPMRSSQLPFHIQPAAPMHPPPYPRTASPYSSFLPPNQCNTKRTVRKRLEPTPGLKRPRLHPAVLSAASRPPTLHVAQKMSASAYFERKRAEEERKLVYKRIRKGRKGKGYVRVVTNIGHLNIELHCDKVPMTCDNFLSLAETKYYDGVRWHRVIPGFIAQTGDPSGTGEGGDSFWGGFFRDEIRTSLTHEGQGVVSMANSGRDTNLSQWFICLDAAPHLDGCHTVFGKVVGGLFVLKKIESEAEMGHPLTVEKIEVLVNPIRQVRDNLRKDASQGNINADNSTSTTPSQDGSPVSMQVGTKHPALHPQTPPPVPYRTENSLRQAKQENLPPARTLLSAVDIPLKEL